MAIGHAAGIAATLALETGGMPAEINPALLQNELVQQGALIGAR
jgi:hypothetical protein